MTRWLFLFLATLAITACGPTYLETQRGVCAAQGKQMVTYKSIATKGYGGRCI